MKYSIIIILLGFYIVSCKKDVQGCKDSSANNYNSEATVDDGSCQYTPNPESICFGYYPNSNFSYSNKTAIYSLNGACQPVDFAVTDVKVEKITDDRRKLITTLDSGVCFEINFDKSQSTLYDNFNNVETRKITFNNENYLIYNYGGQTFDTRNSGSGQMYYQFFSDSHFTYIRYWFTGVFSNQSVLTTNCNNLGWQFTTVY